MSRILFATILLLLAGAALAQQEGGSVQPLAPPTGITAEDSPNDGGGNVVVQWKAAPGAIRYRIERAEGDGEFQDYDTATRSATSYKDTKADTGKPYRYRVAAIDPSGAEAVSEPSAQAVSRAQWFKGNLSGVAIAIAVFVLFIMYFIRRARSGEHLFIRKIAGLDAVEEAVGRATEMGRPILYVAGTGYVSDIGTVASLNVLGEVAKKTAAYGTQMRVPVRDPVVFTVAREVVKGAYTEAGHPDAYDPDSVQFVVENGLAFASAVSGMIVREQPAANFFLGPFGGESLILAETGSTTGAIQIAGTDTTTQLPFFVVACDYTLMGEELYAASAYLSREPLMVGALKGEDVGKVIFMVILVVGTIVALATGWDARQILSTTGR
jgi:hypothetical protein